jgi:hypothetical protein
LKGELEIDIQRGNSHHRLYQKALSLGVHAPIELLHQVTALDPRLHFYIPKINGASYSTEIITTLPDDQPWDLGSKRENWEAMMGVKWDCLKPQFIYGPT